MVTFATLCYLVRGNKVLLQKKAKGYFGEGRWNAPGGKIRNGELPERAAVREMFEETRLRVAGLRFHGLLNFYVGDSKELDQTVFLFVCKQGKGGMRASVEGNLEWFKIDAVPYRDMWEDDRLWLPSLIEGKSLVGDFYFSDNYKHLLSHRMCIARGS